MCLLAFAISEDPRRPFVMGSNRDEFFARPTLALHSWQSAEGTLIHAGRDEQDGGTWLGVNDHGRVAMLTNVRSGTLKSGRRSRGELTTAWLSGTPSIPQWLDELSPEDYGGFNLVFGDVFTQTWYWCSNRDPVDPHRSTATSLHIKQLEPGVYGLSNAALDTPWPKTTALRDALRASIAQLAADADLASHPGLLTSALASRRADVAAPLPETGVSRQVESDLASAFISIPSQGYGTRCSTVVQVFSKPNGGRLHLQMDEWTHPPCPTEAHGLASWDNSQHRRLARTLREDA